jgi:3-phenylpropionate/cinnamic acid dioxygenase small subunit
VTKTDWEQIYELLSRYAYTLDNKDYAGIAACFTDDAEADYPGFTDPLKGHDQILAHMRKALEPLEVTQHTYSNFIIETEADTGRLTCDIIAQHVHGRGPDAQTYLAGGKYRVEVRREGGAWKMSKVAARNVWGVGERGVLPKAG